MKKHFFVYILLIIFAIILTCALVACNSDTEPKHVHKWDAGVVTTAPTCISPGIIKYTCEDCGEEKKDFLDANNVHLWSDNCYHDSNFHWRVCRICGDIDKYEHDFGEKPLNCKIDDLMECKCGVQKTAGEVFSYKVTFICSDKVSIMIYDSQDYSTLGVEATEAYARDGATGELLNNSEGQINFELVSEIGYKVSNVIVSSGTKYKNIEAPSETGRENTYRLTGIAEEGLIVTVTSQIDYLDLPVMVINTENSAPILDKENYVSCMISVENAEDKYCFNDVGAGIRGRGNTTWGLIKKPYKLKFNKKIDLFGNGNAKKWTLIANFADPSLVRNYFAYSIAGENGLLNNTKYTTTVQNIELYLNGEYCGVYLLCEQNEVGSTRVDIDESIVNKDGSLKVNTGYLLESDTAYAPSEGVEGLDYFVVNDECYAIKSPDVEDDIFLENKEEFVGFIQNIIQTAVDNLNNLSNSPENFALINNLLDIPSFVDGYLIDELLQLADGTYSSFYLYYDNTDGKIHRGPIWDYDASCGNAAYNKINDPTFLRASLIYWYNKLLQFDDFVQLVKDRISDLAENNAFINFINEKYDEIINCSASFNRNFEKWDMVLGQSNLTHWNTEIIISMTTWQEQIDYVVEWLTTSYNNLIDVYCSN